MRVRSSANFAWWLVYNSVDVVTLLLFLKKKPSVEYLDDRDLRTQLQQKVPKASYANLFTVCFNLSWLPPLLALNIKSNRHPGSCFITSARSGLTASSWRRSCAHRYEPLLVLCLLSAILQVAFSVQMLFQSGAVDLICYYGWKYGVHH